MGDLRNTHCHEVESLVADARVAKTGDAGKWKKNDVEYAS
jgi:hypothetical protein